MANPHYWVYCDSSKSGDFAQRGTNIKKTSAVAKIDFTLIFNFLNVSKNTKN